ncbi:CHAD domain-containing protein [Lysobacter niastensis]|uniref:CHAD domain-containing protein n=1 Tax=Lysobacter niastensis TaxID=380629 RepID=A0ABS0BCP9_9GAMM|nr:CHAD domain-containing protein [Lysobacter niastensis]MBF6026043.1 CHAD domain-containing protein [Lysobacter niastensis]
MPPRQASASDSTASPGTALCAYALGELDASLAALGCHGEALHEGVHQARKALRRTRAALHLGDGILGPGMAVLDRELRTVNTGLSNLRDAHALVETLERLLEGKLDGHTRTLIKQVHQTALAARAARTESELDADPDLGRRRELIAVLRAAVPALSWSRLTDSALRIALADSDLRMDQARARAVSTGHDDDWHRWRRRARRASQQRRGLEAIGLDPGQGSPFGFDKHTTERLGQAQDLTLLLDHCGADSPFSLPEREAVKAFAKPSLARLRRQIAGAATE